MKRIKGKKFDEFERKLVAGSKKRESDIELESIKLELAETLVQHREIARLTQKQLASKLGVKQQVVARIESGSNITLETLVRFLRILGIAFKVEAIKRKRAEKVLQFLSI